MLGGLRETLVKFKNDIVQEFKKEIKPLSKGVGYLLQELLDPWEKIHSETKSQVEDNERENLKPVTDYYCCPVKKYCMVLGTVSHCQIKCSHIWPKWTKGAGLEILELSQNEANSPRNFLRLHATIAKAFVKKKLYFERIATADSNLIQLKVVILDPSLLQEAIIKGNSDTVTFSDINGKLFDYVFTHESPKRKPFMRLLAQHAKRAVSAAVKVGWIEEDSEIEEHHRRVIELARQSLEPTSVAMKRFEKS
jgi:hypothetical protein